MPLVDVTYCSRLSRDELRRLAQALPHAVSLAVECPEEPYDHDLRPGDVEVRFRQRGEFDVSGVDLVLEVRSRWFESRAANRQERCDHLRDLVVDVVAGLSVGVLLSLPVAGWSQTE